MEPVLGTCPWIISQNRSHPVSLSLEFPYPVSLSLEFPSLELPATGHLGSLSLKIVPLTPERDCHTTCPQGAPVRPQGAPSALLVTNQSMGSLRV